LDAQHQANAEQIRTEGEKLDPDYVANVPEDVFRTIAVMIDPVDPEKTTANRSFRATVEAAYIQGRANYAEEYGRLRREQGWTT
jgi:hypothetical protein